MTHENAPISASDVCVPSSSSRPQYQFPWIPLIAFYSAFTFFMLGVDIALLHFGYRHYSFMAVLPVVFCGVATIISVVTPFSAWLRREAWILGILALLVGGIGTIIHLEIAFTNLEAWDPWHMLERLIFIPRPPLAPAALAGTGLLLLMISGAERWPIAFVERWLRRLSGYWPFRRWTAPDTGASTSETATDE